MATTPRIGGVQSFVAIGVDFISISHLEGYFGPFVGQNRRKKGEKGNKWAEKKVARRGVGPAPPCMVTEEQLHHSDTYMILTACRNY